MLRLQHRARAGHNHPPATSQPSHLLLNRHKNRPHHPLAPNRSKGRHGSTTITTDRALIAFFALRFSNPFRLASPNRREPPPRLLYPNPLSRSYQPLRRRDHQKNSSPGISRLRIFWEMLSPHSRLGDKDHRHCHPHRRKILTLNLQPPKEGRGRANKSRRCSHWEPSRRNPATIM